MLFGTFQFAIFFAAVLALYWNAPKPSRGAVLLAASLVFYSLWIPVYLLLFLADIGVNYALLRAMVRSERPKLYLVASILFSLGILVHFKYMAMLVASVSPLLESTLGWAPGRVEVFLPLGISFYTFQIIALSVDTYRGHGARVESFGRYALFISFFPQLIAGPILRGQDFLPQLDAGGVATMARSRRGVRLILSGLTKKVIFADFLLAGFVADVFEMPEVESGPFLLVALYSFAFQIYFDFSGYTDIARGLACLLGFELPLNFKEPYLSSNPSVFWRRWHITLSTWLRDYLYIFMGGNRRGRARTLLNLMLTMTLGGLWHGASWTFAIWGGYHGLLLVVHRSLSSGLRRIVPSQGVGAGLWSVISVITTFQLVCFGWIFFRAETFEKASDYISGLWGSDYTHGWPVLQTSIVLVCAGMHLLESFIRPRLPKIESKLLAAPWGLALDTVVAGVVVALAIAASGSGGEFIYFQF